MRILLIISIYKSFAEFRKMDVKSYLARIGIDEIPKPTLESLMDIQSRHLLSVPFENLNIHIYNKLPINPDYIFDKIVLQRRGGICYELNYLYRLLLIELGYKTFFYGGRTNKNGTFFDHSFPMVEIEGKKYLTDVGFGDNFLYPLEFKVDVPQEDPKGLFTIEYEGGGYYTVYKGLDGSKYREYTFTLNLRKISEFNERKIYYCTDSRSHFHKNLICSIEKENGRVSLKQSKILFTENGARRYQKVENFHHYVNLLYEHFGMVLTPEERKRLKKTRFWNKRYNRKKTKALLMASSIQQNFTNRLGTFLGG